jgi:hypothetical protein
MSLDMEVSASLSIGDIEKGVGNALSHHREPRPIYTFRSQAKISTGGIVTLDQLGAPPTGSIWQVRCITVYGNDFSTVPSPAYTLALIIGNPDNPSLTGLKVTGLATPSTTFIPDTAIWCHPNEALIIQSGGTVTAGQQVGVNITVEEWREADVSRSSGY